MRQGVALGLVGPSGPVLVQTQPLAWWSDGSVKWVLLDFLAPDLAEGLTVDLTGHGQVEVAASSLCVEEAPQAFVVHTGGASFRVSRARFLALEQASVGGEDLLQAAGGYLSLTDRRGRVVAAILSAAVVESQGPVRVTLRLEGKFRGRRALRAISRLSFFAGTGLVRLDVTLWGPHRASHRGGLWDLGDPGSILFQDFTLHLPLRPGAGLEASWVAEVGQEVGRTTSGFELYQGSSGGDNWNSRNHLNRHGRVPCSFRGYRLRHDEHETQGLRASPVVCLQHDRGGITVALPDFWQQFPKAVEVQGAVLSARLFPGQFNDLFEMQGGEQKTHTLWLSFHPRTAMPCSWLQWAHQPAVVTATPQWYAATEALPWFSPTPRFDGPLDDLLHRATRGNNHLLARREIIDEYGWRNYGDVYADHEAAHYKGPVPIISHYNNQYDLLYGCLLHFLRTGDRYWEALYSPLARHVIDIDIYHTTEDRAAYNGGQFWHTDHYKDAATATHRAYSQANQGPAGHYGGGPCNEHNYTTGLLHYFYLTGDPNARAAVISLANWVINMDDGDQCLLGYFQSGPTGMASRTREPGYHGPGRGCGNSINALLDGWLLTGKRNYLDKADELIRRCVHPADDVHGLDLLNAETRWSYTVFLSVLVRYLEIKAEAGELDRMYVYTRRCLLRYAEWMTNHEVPYFDRIEQLEFPTETWAAQEVRKATVLHLAAAYAEGPLLQNMLRRADQLSARAWIDLMRFGHPATTRALAILLLEGMKASYARTLRTAPAMPACQSEDSDWPPGSFTPQRAAFAARLKRPGGLCVTIWKLANFTRWPRLFRLLRQLW
jgi:hypothetical protein